MARRGRSSRPGFRPRPFWTAGPRSDTAFAAPAVVSTLSGDATALINTGLEITSDAVTLRRTRGFLNLVWSGDGGDVGVVAAAIGIATVEAFGVGITALPGPLSDPQEDWLWHSHAASNRLVTAETDNLGNNVINMIIDSKAMRRLQPNDVIYGIVQQFEGAADNTVCLAVMMTRVLLSESSRG